MSVVEMYVFTVVWSLFKHVPQWTINSIMPMWNIINRKRKRKSEEKILLASRRIKKSI